VGRLLVVAATPCGPTGRRLQYKVGMKYGDGVAKVEGDDRTNPRGKESGGGSRGVAGPGYCRCRNWWIARDKQFISIILITIVPLHSGHAQGWLYSTEGD
jgi:hypothetical protein